MFSIHPGLESTFSLLEAAGYPDKKLRFVHIAGTNGKGSTGAMLEAAFRHAGLKTGFYSSPHLIDVRERFRINGKMPKKEIFERGVMALAQVVNGKRFSYFEFTTVLAAKLFAEAGCDIVVWETGMGGRLDATNTVTPAVSVITNVALDHEKYLGKTISAIAGEKAGIIKPGIPVFTGFMPDEAYQRIVAEAEKNHSEVIATSGEVPPMLDFDQKTHTQRFIVDPDIEVKLPLPGKMQRRNAVNVIHILKYFADQGVISLDAALAGIARTVWPGRMQFVSDRFIIDGGHNPDGITALTEALTEIFPGEKFTLIYGAFQDKAVENCLKIWKDHVNEVFAVELPPSTRKSCSGAEIRDLFAEIAPACPVYPAKSIASALELARKNSATSRVVVSGSLYLAGEVLELLYGKNGAGDLA